MSGRKRARGAWSEDEDDEFEEKDEDEEKGKKVKEVEEVGEVPAKRPATILIDNSPLEPHKLYFTKVFNI